MFYKTYIGPSKEAEDGSHEEYDYQIPCLNMKHFYAEYISDPIMFPYYNTGKAAVVIAKYYEGAIINGTITFRGNPVNAEIAVLKNLTYYGDVSIQIGHDAVTTTTGNFSLIVGADATLQIRRYYSEEIRPFIMKNVTFNGEIGSEMAPITDDDAMRKGTNYERFINIEIEPATVEGYIYVDNDDDRSYNKSIDTPLKNVNVTLYDITDAVNPRARLVTDEYGHYYAYDQKPGYYLIRVEQDGFVLRDHLAEFYEYDNYVNISQTKHSAIEGKVYFEDESNTISDASVKLYYLSKDPAENLKEKIFIDSQITGADGKFKFPKTLIPGEYELNVTKGELYRKVQQFPLEENTTQTTNVALEYTPVTVSGYAIYNGEAVGVVNIGALPDPEIENNTAVSEKAQSSEDGFYTIDLIPGNYDMTFEIVYEATTIVYSFYDKLNVSIGEVSKSYDISLTKSSATTSGYTSFGGKNIANISNIIFDPDETVENNTALVGNVAPSNFEGFYSLELSPGTYIVSINHPFTENDKNYTYTFDDKLKVEEKDIEDGISYNIVMTKSESE
jgi:hypothetical protein